MIFNCSVVLCASKSPYSPPCPPKGGLNTLYSPLQGVGGNTYTENHREVTEGHREELEIINTQELIKFKKVFNNITCDVSLLMTKK
jgi:hypothetical protein